MDLHAARMGEKRYACKLSVGKSEVQRLPSKPVCRWKDYIKMWILHKYFVCVCVCLFVCVCVCSRLTRPNIGTSGRLTIM
jgi:hypothetical protein